MAKRIYGAETHFDNIQLQAQKEMRFADADSSNYAAIKAPATIGANYTLTLPVDDGTASQVLSTDGSGVLSWVSALTSALTSGSILVGIAGVAAPVDTAAQGDITASSTGLNINAGAILNADINAAAAIALSKLAALTASRALVSDGSGVISVSAVTSTELGYVAGVTSGIQSQINSLSSIITNFEWQPSVISRSTTPPGSPTTGDRYLVIATATGAWTGQEDHIAQYTGSSWTFITPTTGTFVAVDDETDGLYLFGGSSWTKKYFEATTASTGLVKVGFDIRLDASSAGAGLAFTTGVLSVNVDGSTLEINSDTLRVKDLGITAAKLAADSVTTAKILDANVTNAKIAAGVDAVKIADGSVSNTEFQYLDGVTSSIQTQLDAKVRKVAATWANADGATKAITHSLGTKDILVQVYDTADDATIEVDSVVRTSTTVVTLTASQAPSTNWRVVITG